MSERPPRTPMFQQYHALKEGHPGAILLFRMGDFYEMFGDDAKVASRLLELTLTARGKGTANVVPMCGFPHHQLDNYTAKLVRANQRVAICDQVEDPRQAKGLVRREVVRMVTPGTVTDPSQLEAKENLWIGSVATVAGRLGAAFLDGSTGEFLASETGPEDEDPWDSLSDLLKSFGPREIIHPEGFSWGKGVSFARTSDTVRTEADPYGFTPAAADELLRRQFDVRSLDGFGFRDRPAAIAAAGGLLQYLKDTQKSDLEHLDAPRYHEPADHLLLDAATRRNLELDRSIRDGGRRNTLVHTLDYTVTPAGGRQLRSWLLAPLLEVQTIAERQDSVEEFLGRGDLRLRTTTELKGVHDVERLLARTVTGTATPRDLLGLRSSLQRLPALIDGLAGARAHLTRRTVDAIDPCSDITERLEKGLVDDPPAHLRDGGFIRDGFNGELDELRSIQRDGKSYIAALQTHERESTGIASLKVRYNKVFGYFIEVSKPNLHLVPESYHRKQTISTGERFITPELKDYESKILNAQERIEVLELELFQQLRVSVAAQASRLKAVARATATLDVLAGLAELAAQNDYRRPNVHGGRGLKIVGGRHPVVEQSLVDSRFIPNDTELEAGARAIAVLTGPNMGGKSTYLRQVALIVLMAQMGSFVPAEEAEIGIVDRVFCRVGASDSLAEGQSTFMVEMTETANILRHATANSLLLLDEIGRGTSTFDGLSIAWAVVEQLAATVGGAPRTLFATHYHELTELAVEIDKVLNLRMAVREWDEGVIFTHRVEPGASDRSYGIQVARLAGVPRNVVQRAREILDNLERDEYGRDGHPKRARRDAQAAQRNTLRQPSLFTAIDTAPAASPAEREIIDQLRGRDPNDLTPLEALNLLSAWRRKLEGDSGSEDK